MREGEDSSCIVHAGSGPQAWPFGIKYRFRQDQCLARLARNSHMNPVRRASQSRFDIADGQRLPDRTPIGPAGDLTGRGAVGQKDRRSTQGVLILVMHVQHHTPLACRPLGDGFVCGLAREVSFHTDLPRKTLFLRPVFGPVVSAPCAIASLRPAGS